MKTLSHETLRNRFLAACGKMRAQGGDTTGPFPDNIFYRTETDGLGSPHVEIDSITYQFVVSERGTEYERRITTDPDEILYWLVETVAEDMALRYELEHRVEGQDGRRLSFEKEIEYLAAVNTEWGVTKRREIEAILKRHPYRDTGEGTTG